MPWTPAAKMFLNQRYRSEAQIDIAYRHCVSFSSTAPRIAPLNFGNSDNKMAMLHKYIA